MNKTKKELFEENKKLKMQLNLIKDWFCINEKEEEDFIDVIYKNKKIINITKKICYIASILFLCGTCYILGLMKG